MNKEAPAHKIPHHSRRDFIQKTSLMMLTSAVASVDAVLARVAAAEAPLDQKEEMPVGSNIYGWGQYYQRMGKDVNQNLDEVFSALRDAGYDYLEGFLDVAHPENNLGFAERMRAKGLRPVSIYTGARLHESGKASEVVHKLLEAAKVCQHAGYRVVDCNPEPIGREKTDEELKTQASALNELGEGLKKLGLRLGIHNHMPEMANRAREFHHDLRQTDPKAVGLCYDVHWVFRGGIAPPEVLNQYGNRIVSWHLRQSRDKIWWEELDKGDVDYAFVAQYAQEHRLSAPYTVELAIEKGTNITHSVVENHQRSREFVRKVFGV